MEEAERESNSKTGQKQAIEVGHRVEILKERGFVRFIGSLQSSNQDLSSTLWVGVEWDNPTRGKHYGTYKDKKYFHCKRNKGSFVKLIDVEKSSRNCFVDALMDKYCFDNLEEISQNSNVFQGNKIAQFVGFQKAADQFRKVSYLKHIALPNFAIYRAGNDLDLKSGILASVEVLDISNNLFSEFSEVLNIIRHAPSLRELILSNNRFEYIETASTTISNPVCLLVMNGCFYDFETLIHSLGYFPHIEELHISQNACNYDFVRLANACSKLKALYLDSCNIPTWEELAPFGTLSSLKKLSLAGNNISSISVTTDEHGNNGACGFQQLELINLSGNKLKGLRVIDELAKLPALKSLRIDDLLMDSGELVPRFQFIGRLKHLLYLNGSFISNSERRDAEMTYIKHICEEMMRHSLQDPETVFPRLEELKKLYSDYFFEKLNELKKRRVD
ncbi:Tubulin-specific chaperone E [Galdieria sulphuraria]|nr:Tubulin-specific chaperone E [Galdieria sulphuraria]